MNNLLPNETEQLINDWRAAILEKNKWELCSDRLAESIIEIHAYVEATANVHPDLKAIVLRAEQNWESYKRLKHWE